MQELSATDNTLIETRRPRWGVVVVLLAVATAAAHGWSLDDRLFFDDHWHQKMLRERGWSPGDLLDSTTLDPQNFQPRTWWQQRETSWHYARPFSVVVMKAVYALGGGRVWPHRLVSILVHLGGAVLVTVMAWWLTRRRGWAVVAGLLFVVYSHSVFAVGWIAAQNSVLQTVLTLAALMCYVRASGVHLAPGRSHSAHEQAARGQPAHEQTPPSHPAHEQAPPAHPAHEQTPPSHPAHEQAPPAHPAHQRAPRLRPGLAGACVVLYVLALLSRENAVMLPVMAVGFDAAFGRWAVVRRRAGIYALLGAVTVAFVAWRLGMVHHALPEVYYHRIRSPGDIAWLAAKFVHYLVASVWLSPMTVGPAGRPNPWASRPGDMALAVAIAGILLAGYAVAMRKRRGWWLWPLWLVLAILPVLPVLATPHSGYLCGVAFAIGMVLPAAAATGARARKWGRFVAIWFLVATCCYMPIYRTLWNGMLAAEEYTVTGLAADPAPAEPTDVYFINLPFVNVYMPVCLEEVWGPPAANARFHVLTYAPDLLRVDQPIRVEQSGPRTLDVWLPQAPSTGLHPNSGWFSGLLGRFLIEAMRSDGPLTAGQVVHGDGVSAEVVQADADGVWQLRFAFPKDLADKSYRFYVQTPTHPAARLKFAPPAAGCHAHAAVCVGMSSPDDMPTPQNPAWACHPATGPDLPAGPPPTLTQVASAAARLDQGEYAAGRVLWEGVMRGTPDVQDFAWARLSQAAGEVAEACGAPEIEIFHSPADFAAGTQTRLLPPETDLQRAYLWWSNEVDESILEQSVSRRYLFEPARRRRDRLFFVLGVTNWIIRSDIYLTGPPFPGPTSPESRTTSGPMPIPAAPTTSRDLSLEGNSNASPPR